MKIILRHAQNGHDISITHKGLGLCAGLLLLLCSLALKAQPLSVFVLQSEDVHPAIKSARSTVQEAQAGLQGAKKQYWPTPSVTLEQVNPSSADPAYGGRGNSHIYRLQQPLWTWGRISAGVDKAQLQGDTAEAHVLEVRQQVAFDTVQAWIEWTGAGEKAAVVERSLTKYIGLRDLVERRIESGASAPAERSTTLARLGQAQVQLTAFRTAQAMAQAKLQQLSGLAAQASPVLSSPDPSMVMPSLQDVLDFSPVLKKSQLQIELAQADVRVRRAQGYPEAYARMEHQRYPAGQNAHRVFVGVQSNFGAGLSNLDEVAALEQRITSLREDATAKKMEVTQQYTSQNLSLQQSLQSMPALQANVDSNTESLASMERQFLTGRRSWIDVLNAVRELTQAELDLVDAKLMIWRAQWQLSLLAMPVSEVPRFFEKTGS